MGPSSAALEAMEAVLGGGAPAGRYPFDAARGLPGTIAEILGVPADRVMVGNGSTQLLRTATQVFTSPERPLVAGALTYEECAGYADVVGHAVRTVPLAADMSLDLDGMADAAAGGGMVFLNNPNNPTGIVHSEAEVARCVERVLAADPDVMVCVDEAYHDYVTDPSYATAIPLAVDDERVIVARTFSKAHGMAGMRIGYVVGHPTALGRMRRWHYGLSLNVLALASASASIRDETTIRRERDRNTEARDYTTGWFRQHGLGATDSQTNFIFAETRMAAGEFRAGCAERGFRVGRDFPPFENSHARISIGTLEQMQRATAAFAEILKVRAVA
jgi:histidinol-phosphate/aromatic aminotransferase/cobyric acid decarboxylase-like protein